MDIEIKVIKLIINKNQMIDIDLSLYEEALDDKDMIQLELTVNGEKISCNSDNFFSALLDVRRNLESKNIQIACNGAAKNIYPSPMQISMGNGRKAYKLCKGQQARNSEIVDIFDYDKTLNFVSIDEQEEFYSEWLKSVME